MQRASNVWNEPRIWLPGACVFTSHHRDLYLWLLCHCPSIVFEFMIIRYSTPPKLSSISCNFMTPESKGFTLLFDSSGLKMSLHLSMVWLHAFHPVRVTIYNLSCAAPVIWIILRIGSANERHRYIVTSYFIGSAHTQNGPCAKYTRLPYHWMGLRASYHPSVPGHQTAKEIMFFCFCF